jgi:hypothetical protein
VYGGNKLLTRPFHHLRHPRHCAAPPPRTLGKIMTLPAPAYSAISRSYQSQSSLIVITLTVTTHSHHSQSPPQSSSQSLLTVITRGHCSRSSFCPHPCPPTLLLVSKDRRKETGRGEQCSVHKTSTHQHINTIINTSHQHINTSGNHDFGRGVDGWDTA